MYKTISAVIVWTGIMFNVLLAQDFTWENIGTEDLNFQALLVSRQDNKIIFAGLPGSVLRSDNGGKSWRRILTIRGGMRNINALVMRESDPNAIYAATDNGLYRSNNLGEHWERIFRGKNSWENQCIAVSVNSRIILVGTKAGLFISKDGGRNWHKQDFDIGNRGILNIDLAGDNKIIYLAAENGVFKSLDDGQGWEKIFVNNSLRDANEETDRDEQDEPEKLRNINFVKADFHDSNRLYLSSARGVYYSLNRGQSWEKLTEYGLLNRDVKMFCLSDNSGIFALTSSGVFLYTGQRWSEISFGLAVGRLNYLALDNLNNIYIAGEKGIYKSAQSDAAGIKHISLIGEYLKHEPNIRDVQKAAIRYAEVNPEKISQWRKQAAKKALLPQLSVGLERNTADLWHWEGGSTTKSDDDTLRRGRDNLDWDVALSWDLSDVIWSEAQTSIDVRSKLMVELRDDVLDQVNKLYFERLRVKNELDNLAIEDRDRRFQKQLKLEELTASLDSLTSGYYSEQLHLLALKQG